MKFEISESSQEGGCGGEECGSSNVQSSSPAGMSLEITLNNDDFICHDFLRMNKIIKKLKK